ncbi:LysR substrate-binding domain-containing protein [Achromobacter sp.]|uniref:LysR substrate-binding domain-containing protein n=1 Tax=Achromobacter sp. TaxID=134375 RepID=UPI002F95946E
MTNSLSGIDVFVAVVEAGSFAQAAEGLHLTRSAVGKRIARLEQRLGVPLFHRTTRSQSLTDEGSLFYEHCRRALAEVRTGEAALESGKGHVNGTLRVSMPVLFGHLCVAPILLELAREHPGLTLEMSFNDRMTDLVEEGLDLVIRNGVPPDSGDLAARRLGEHGMVFCASPSYLQRHGEPDTPEALQHHEGVAYTRQGRVLDWQLRAEGRTLAIRPNARLQMDDLRGVADAAVAGFGIAWLPTWLAREPLERGELRKVLPDRASVMYPINALWPYTPHLSLKTRLAVDELVKKLPARLATAEQ